jgi:hypothetical protein
MDTRSPLSARELVDEYFIENRTRLLEIAAFLDRLERADPGYASTDFRMKAFGEAVATLTGSDRLDRIQMLLSDPTVEPLGALDRKSAIGAYDRWK